jgi:hypothetical protein
MKRIQRLLDPKEAASEVDIVMRGPAFGREFYLISKKALWKLNPDLATEVGEAAVEASNALANKLVGKAGVTMFDNFQAASAPIT